MGKPDTWQRIGDVARRVLTGHTATEEQERAARALLADILADEPQLTQREIDLGSQ